MKRFFRMKILKAKLLILLLNCTSMRIPTACVIISYRLQFAIPPEIIRKSMI